MVVKKEQDADDGKRYPHESRWRFDYAWMANEVVYLGCDEYDDGD